MFYQFLYKIIQPILRLFYRAVFFFKAVDTVNVPQGGAVICGNHKSNHDGLLVAAFAPRQLIFLVKKEVFKNPVISTLLQGLGLRPVDRKGSEVGLIKMSLSALRSGGGLVIFPEGTRFCKDVNDSKDGAIVLALKTKVPIVPVHIVSTYKPFKPSVIKFGKPLDLSDYYDKKLTSQETHELTIKLMNTIYSL